MKRLAAIAGFVAALLLPSPALAQVTVPCLGLLGCGLDPSNVLFNVLPRVAVLMITIAAGSSVIFIIISGTRMVIMFGDEGEVTKAKNGILYALGGLGLCLTATAIVAAVATEKITGTADDLLVAAMQTVVRIILTFFNVLFVISIIYGGYLIMLSNGKQDGYNKGISAIKWAIAGAIIVNISRALVQAFLNLGL